jgi:hypothetical protein
LIILESNADGVNKHKDSDDFYINIRSTKDWVGIMEICGFNLVSKNSYSEYGLMFLGNVNSTLDFLRSKSADNKDEDDEDLQETIVIKVILMLFTPIDKWLSLPFPINRSDRMLFLFRKQ